MKTVHIIEFGWQLSSQPLGENTAEDLKRRLQNKGLQAFTRNVPEKPATTRPAKATSSSYLTTDS